MRAPRFLVPLVALALLAAVSCRDPGDDDDARPTTTPPPATEAPSTTAAPGAGWRCHPDQAADPCLTADLATTVYDFALTPTLDEAPPASDPTADCFYAHPAAADDAQALAWIQAEAARLRTVCRVFVPEYTAGDAAAVLAAFDRYLAEDGGDRPFVLLGHAEGSDLLTRVAQERIDGDEALRGRLLSAMLIGGLAVQVPTGQPVGGTFQNLPVCGDRDQTGCIISFHTWALGSQPSPSSPLFAGIGPGMQAVCTFPAGLDGSRGQFREAIFPVTSAAVPAPTVPGLPPADTPFVGLSEYFVGSCIPLGGGISYLAIEPSIDPDDQRRPGPLTDPALGDAGLGTQNLDVVVTLGDLLALIERQAATRS